jgi:hypothetical protein
LVAFHTKRTVSIIPKPRKPLASVYWKDAGGRRTELLAPDFPSL